MEQKRENCLNLFTVLTLKFASNGSTFEDTTGMLQLRKCGNRSFELDSVTYMNVVKVTGGPLFSIAKRIVITNQGKLKVPEKRGSLPFSLLPHTSWFDQ